MLTVIEFKPLVLPNGHKLATEGELRAYILGAELARTQMEVGVETMIHNARLAEREG